MLRLDKISKNAKVYNTYFDKNQDAEYERLQQNKEDNDSAGALKSSMTFNVNSVSVDNIDNIRAKLQAGVGCSVRISGLRRMKQTYYE
jgi:hypothetical protein